MFQSSSSPKADAISSSKSSTLYKSVSILIQPEGWMLYYLIKLSSLYLLFHPHPARRLDAIRVVVGQPPHTKCFILIQPEGWILCSCTIPSLKASCFILIQPEGWMLWTDCKANRLLQVSILIQPEGWMLRLPSLYLLWLHYVSILIQPRLDAMLCRQKVSIF